MLPKSWCTKLFRTVQARSKRRPFEKAPLGILRLEERTLLSAATHLVFSQGPTTAIVGKSIAPPIEVAALDQFNQLDASFNGAVSLALQNNPGNAALNGVTTAKANGGRAVFSGLSVSGPGTAYTLVASFATLPKPMVGLSFQDGLGLGEIPIRAFSWGETTIVAIPGGSAGKSTVQDFHLTIDPTIADPALLAAGASGKHAAKAVVHVRMLSGLEYLTYTLTDVQISSYQTDSSSVPSNATITLGFGLVEESYRPINPDGSLGAAVVSSWDQRNLTGTGTGSLVGPTSANPPAFGATFDGGEFVVQSYSWGETTALSTTGGGGGAAKATLQDFSLQLQPGSADPTFFANAVRGKAIQQVVLHVRKNGQEYLTYTLSNVLITSYQTDGSGTISLKLNFAQIDESYSAFNPDGSLGAAVTSRWNQMNNSGSGSGLLQGPTQAPPPALGATFDDGEFTVQSYSWGETTPVSTAGGGAGAGVATLQDFSLNLQPGSADPVFLANAASGRHIQKVLLHVRKNGQEYLTYTLSDVLITSYQVDSSGNVSLKLNFAQIDESYRPFNADGSLGTAVASSWNQKTNTGSGTGALTGPTPATPPALGATFDGGELLVQSYSWGETTTVSTAGGGGGVGKATLQDLNLTLQPGSADPTFLANAASGKHIQRVVLHVRMNGLEYLTYTLSDVLITSYQTAASGIAKLKLNFAQIEESYHSFNPDGSLGPAVVSSWNQKTNLGSGSGPLIGPTPAPPPAQGVTFDSGELAVQSYSWGEATTVSTTGGGGGVGKATLQDFTLNLQPGTADPTFLADAASGKHIQTVVVHVRKNGLEYLTYTLSDVFITSYQTDEIGIASVQLNFAQIDESYRPFAPDGSLGLAVTSSWNQKTNTGSGAGTLVGPTPSTPPALGATFDGGELLVQSYSWGEATTVSTTGGGGGVGKATLQDFRVQLQPGSTDPVFLANAASGKRIQKVVLHVRTNGQEYLTYTLSDVLITSYQTDASGSVSLKLSFAQIDESYAPLDPDGSLGAAILSSWNQNTNTGSGDNVHDPAPSIPSVVSSSFDVNETANQRYVTAVYTDVLGRAVDSVGLQFWSTQLDQGTARAAFVRLIDHSAEYFATIVKPVYQRFLGRAADQAGLDFWVGRMSSGLTDEQLEASFIGSPEFYQHAGGTDKAWIDAVYLNLLARQADPAGESFWVGQLTQGADRASVALGFAASPEREGQHVLELYRKYLGRDAGPSEIGFWVGQFKLGVTNEDIVTGFVASDEYFARHTSN